MEVLQTLISAGQVWESVITDSFTFLENEERRCATVWIASQISDVFVGNSTPHGSPSPISPAHSLRVALSSCLLTSQTQCDNIRQLLSAIASPNELSQLSEMYAPPSPMKSTFSFSMGSYRPVSHPGSPERNEPLEARKKRSTWNGSYSTLAFAGGPLAPQIARRREKRRFDLDALIGTPTQSRGSLSAAPMSPSRLWPLADVSEEEPVLGADPFGIIEDDKTFGAAALNLHRKQRNSGLRMLELKQHSVPLSLAQARSTTRRRSVASSATRYTNMQSARHPLTFSALHQALQSSLASKRFACAHLLALRFEEDDEIYWEDVRSVMSLLTSAFVEASSRISEVLDEVEERHLQLDDSVTEDPSGVDTPASPGSPSPCTASKFPPSFLLGAPPSIDSFAPLPSHLSRFSSHLDAISSALDDAREQLSQCIALLKEDIHSSHPSSLSSSTAGKNAALQAYEGVRRELGLALREYERGRESLVHIVSPPTPQGVDMDDGVAAFEQCPSVQEERVAAGDNTAESDRSLTISTSDGDVIDTDDVLDHSSFTTSTEFFPPPGIEQVYEAETTGVGTFSRERSKLSREERIKLARAGREAPTKGDPDASFLKPEPIGPGGEVIQELKDVIWKVGERRRKMTESQLRSVVSNASSSLPSPPQCTATPVNILPQGPTLS